MNLIATEGIENRATGSGGMAHFSGIMSANIEDITATGNEAGDSGGAFAVIDSIRMVSATTSSSLQANVARSRGGGLFVDDSAVKVASTKMLSNAVEQGDGGAAAASGSPAQLSFPDTERTVVEVVLDWSASGNLCPDNDVYGYCSSETRYTCKELKAWGMHEDCSGCDCNHQG